MNEKDILDEALAETGFRFSVNEGGKHAYNVDAPYCFLDGDGIRFYLMFPEECRFMLTDSGSCLFHLSAMSCRDWDFGKIKKYSDKYLEPEGVHLNDGEMRIEGEIGALGCALLDMTRAFLLLEVKFLEWKWIVR